MKRTYLSLALLALAGGSTCADPLDTTYNKTFYFIPIGGFQDSTIDQLRTSLFSKTGGIEPDNMQVGFFEVAGWFTEYTQGSYYDYIYEPNFPYPGGMFPDRGWEAVKMMDVARANDIKVGMGINGPPWGDGTDQSFDNLNTFLETYDAGDGPGSFLQRDRTGNFRNAAVAQDPTIDENQTQHGQLEMQVTLSQNCTLLQQYWRRNLKQTTRLLQFYRDQHPDLVVFLTGSAEVAQNIHMNVDFADYSQWSISEFRDWLSGSGLYEGEGQYNSLAGFNSAFGLSYATWEDVTPPTVSNWGPNTYWRKWHEFREHQVHKVVQNQNSISVEMGWSPDRVFGHQVPGPVYSQWDNIDSMMATPYTTAFTYESGNGITTYQEDAFDPILFNAMYDNDPNWGIFEYNPIEMVNNQLVPGHFDRCTHALSTVWDGKCHILSPYLWDGGDMTSPIGMYTIVGNPFEEALQNWFQEHQNDSYEGPPRYEWHPDSRSPIWGMSRSRDIESFSGFGGLNFDTGVCYGTTTDTQPSLSFWFDESEDRSLVSYDYYEASFRLSLDPPSGDDPGDGSLMWVDENDQEYSIAFPLKKGEYVYRINLGGHDNWLNKKIKSISLQPSSLTGTFIGLDWFMLDANFHWDFNDANEVYGVSGFQSYTVSNGSFSGTDNSGDGYIGLTTDASDFNEDADRVVINTDIFNRLRVRMNPSAAGTTELFWWHRDDLYGEEFSARGQPFTSAGEQVVEINLDEHPEWDGTVTRLRLDPVNTSGVSVDIESVSLVPELLAPEPQVRDLILNTTRPVFVWDQPIEPDHSGLSYDFQLCSEDSFSAPQINLSFLRTDRYIHDGSPELEGHYWWRVRSCDDQGNFSAWSFPMPVFVKPWHFNVVEDLQQSDGFHTIAINDGVWQGTNGAFFGTLGATFNNGNERGSRINADLYPIIHLRLKQPEDTGSGTARFHFKPKDGTETSVSFDYTAEVDFVDYYFDLREHSNWKGWVEYVRFQPDLWLGRTLYLDFAEFLPELPSQHSDVSSDCFLVF